MNTPGGLYGPDPQTSLLFKLGQSLSSVLDLPELLRRILSAAIELTHAQEGTLLFSAPHLADMSLRVTPNADGSLQYESLNAPDSSETNSMSPETSSPPAPQDARASVPLQFKGETLGTLAIRHPAGKVQFTPEVQALLAGLGGFASVALENARLYQEALDRARELALMVDASNTVSSSIDLGSVLNAIARVMMRTLDAHWCTIFGWQDQTRRLQKLAEHRYVVWAPDSAPLAWPLFRSTSYPPLSRDLQAVQVLPDSDPEQLALLEAIGIQRALILPLQVGGQIVGLVELADTRIRDEYPPSQLARCMRSALDLSTYVQHVSAADPEELVAATRLLLANAGAHWCTVYACCDPDGRPARLLTIGSAMWQELDGPEIDIDGLPTLRIVIEEQRVGVLRSTDEGLTTEELALFEPLGPSAMLALPLTFKGNVVGLITLLDIDPLREFPARQTGLASALAGQAAVALEHAHLVRDLQHSLEEQRKMQSHLVHSARLSALGELSTVVAHQVNNPLTTVIADAEMLVQDLPEDQPTHLSAEAILRAGQRAKVVVERILKMARMETEPQRVAVNETINNTVTLVGGRLKRHPVTLTLHLAGDLPPVLAVPGHLEDVWMNLLINGLDAILEASREQGTLDVFTKRAQDDKMVVIVIEDNGCGMEPEQMLRAADPYYTTKPTGKGTGLGLYICQQIVADHNGEMILESTPGTGTTVTVRLPVTSTPGEEASWPTS